MLRSHFATALCLATLLACTAGADAQKTPVVPPPAGATGLQDAALNVHTPVPLWPHGAPGALGTAEVDVPAVSVYLPAANPTQTVVIVAPGGSYAGLAMDHEGLQVAQWLNAHGVAAVVLRYRLGPRYHHPIELGDGQRAVRFTRAHAADLHVLPNHVGFWGFSAGGHLASSVGTHFDQGLPGGADEIDRQSSRPDFLVLAYPVISMQNGVTHDVSKRMLLGDSPDASLVDLMSNEKQVTAQTPPTFLFSTTDDSLVPVMNSVLFYQALVANHVPAEMHVFEHGRHGVGLAQTDRELGLWPELLFNWMRANGWAQ